MCSEVNMPAPEGGDCRDWPGGVWGGVEWVDAAETFLEREVAVDCEAVDTFCRLRGGAMGGRRGNFRWCCFGGTSNTQFQLLRADFGQ